VYIRLDNYPRGNTGNSDIGRNILQDNSARTNYNVVTYRDTLLYRRAGTDKGSSADMHVSGDSRAARDVRMVSHCATVFNDSPTVDYRVDSDPRTRVYDRIRQKFLPTRVPADAADADDKASHAGGLERAQKIIAAEHRNTHDLCSAKVRVWIKESSELHSVQLKGVNNDACVSASTKHHTQHFSISHWMTRYRGKTS
jgi:hypothetical protein